MAGYSDRAPSGGTGAAVTAHQTTYDESGQGLGDGIRTSSEPDDKRLRHGLDLAKRGDLAGAEEQLRSLLAEHPDHAPAHLHLARILLARDRLAEAALLLEGLLVDGKSQGPHEFEITLLAAEARLRAGQPAQAGAWGLRALDLAPQDTRAMYTVALAYQQTGRLEQARSLLNEVVRVAPGAVHAWVNKGLAEKQLGRFDDAVASFTRAVALDPRLAPAHYSLGLIHLTAGRHVEAEQSFRMALRGDPRHIRAAIQLATLLRHEGRMNEAADIYREILQYDPGNAIANFYADTLQRPDEPARVPAGVVQALYTGQSVGRDLECSLLGHLNYQTPAILDAALRKVYGEEHPALDILDAGCGSGLFGALVHARAKRLVGVDLAAPMIEECQSKDVYDDLQVRDIVDYLGQTQERFDLIVAMDVFCFFGDLGPLMRLCAGVLRPGGVLACSVERASGNRPWVFHRYSHFLHSAAHLRQAAAGAGMHEVQITECALRRELGEDRMGFVALFAR